MRIDFSKLQQAEQTQRQPSPPLVNNLPSFWQNQQSYQRSFQPEVHQDINSYSFSVSFPYEVNRKLSPSSINKQLSYLQANRVLPQSTLRFIQNTLESDRQKSESPKKKDSSRVTEYKNQESIIKLEQVVDSYKQQLSERTNQNINKIAVQISPKKQKIIPIKKMVQPKKKFSYKKKLCLGICKKLKNQPILQRQQSMDEVTLKPILNYTMNSRAYKDMSKKRQQHFTSCNSNVFQSLYNDAALYAKKRQIQKVIAEEEAKLQRKKSSRMTVTTTFEQRYQRSLEKEAEKKRKAQHKIRYDQETGRRYFVPDTTISQMTYLTLFKSTASLEPYHMEKPRPVRSNYYSRQSSKLNYSPEQITTTLNRSCELPSSYDHKYCANRKIAERDGQLAQLYVNLLWNQQDVKDEQLSKEEKHVLGKFLQNVAQFQYGRSVSRQVFTALFKKHYNALNLFDKAIINARLKNCRQQRKIAEQSIVSQQQSYLADDLSSPKRKRYHNLSHVSKFFFV